MNKAVKPARTNRGGGRKDAAGESCVWTPPVRHLNSDRHHIGGVVTERRDIAEEAPVAFTYNGTAHAVMMATPSDLEDFAIGFSLSAQIIKHLREIEKLDIVHHADGIEVQMWLVEHRAQILGQRRRQLAGPTGCGLCGVETIADALPPISRVSSGLTISPREVTEAMDALAIAQNLYCTTRATHAAGFFVPRQGLISVREDVGRHNALDKVLGDLSRRNIAGSDGLVLLTSRISVELVQKAAILGAPIVAAISAPTALAIRSADEAGITLIGIVRKDGFEVFTGSHRITQG
jgi:FdhD protein